MADFLPDNTASRPRRRRSETHCGDSPQVAAVTLSSVKLCGVVWGIVTGVSGEITASVFRT